MSFPLVGYLSYSPLIKGVRGLCEEGFSPRRVAEATGQARMTQLHTRMWFYFMDLLINTEE